jgi:hypothetical protein
MLLTLEVASVFLCTCEAFEQLAMKSLRGLVNARASRDWKGSMIEQIRRMKLLLEYVTDVTDFDLVTPSGEDRRVLRDFDQMSGLPNKRERIRRLAEGLQDAAVTESNRRRERSDRIREGVLSIIAGLALCSFWADLLGGIEFFSALTPAQRWLRTREIIGLALLAALLLFIAIWAISVARERRLERQNNRGSNS